MARSVNRDARHSRQACRSHRRPRILRNDSCWPAKLASGNPPPSHWNERRHLFPLQTLHRVRGRHGDLGLEIGRDLRRQDALSNFSAALRQISNVSRIQSVERAANEVFQMIRTQEVPVVAPAVIAKPSGTSTPFVPSSLTISPKEAFLPPTMGISLIPISQKKRMNLRAAMVSLRPLTFLVHP